MNSNTLEECKHERYVAPKGGKWECARCGLLKSTIESTKSGDIAPIINKAGLGHATGDNFPKSPDLESSKGWEEEFDEKFTKKRHDGYHELINIHAPDIKQFIQQTLDERTKNVINELESNPLPGKLVGEDISLMLWIEEKQRQLKSKYGIK